MAKVLEAACLDPELDRIIKEIDLHYQQEAGIIGDSLGDNGGDN